MSNCVYIDLGDGDFIKPNFSKPPTPEMIAEAKAWGIAFKEKRKALEAKGICTRCDGKGKWRTRDLDRADFAFKDNVCPTCQGTGHTKAPSPSEKEKP